MSSPTVKEFLSLKQPDSGWTDHQKKVYGIYYDQLRWTWDLLEDGVTREFWEGETKPKEPTNSFRTYYAENFDDDQLANIIEAFGF